jgi:hypothetical protein
MRFVLVAAAALAALTAAFAVPAGAHVTAPGPQCGGTLWNTGKSAVQWTPTATTVPDVAKLSAPAKIGTTRSTAFQKQVWKVTAVIQSFRLASNGELVLQLFDIQSSTYMNAYLPSAACLSSTARGRAQMLATRSAFLKQCGAATNNWTPLGATADLTGVGFWNSVKTTAGAAKNGAELRPVLSLNITQGCGKF